MSSDAEPPDDPEKGPYVVGPKRPPKDSRFKPGKSGNPRGRPKATLTREAVARMLADALLETKIKAKKGGRQVKTSVLEAMFIRQAQLAISGDTKAFASLFAVIDRLARDEPATTPTDDDARVDRVILQRGLAAEAAAPDRRGPSEDGTSAVVAESPLQTEASDGQDGDDCDEAAGDA